MNGFATRLYIVRAVRWITCPCRITTACIIKPKNVTRKIVRG